ncbi:hypothetical protein [Hamadaea tsunoensis]|uniref:hypothetical protein n=1 Tax=Hamadaea tsunoensis TaxID=53368 RepID=UPI000484A72A|nr:hypothetical protein [Hamadaea tsunoensis]
MQTLLSLLGVVIGAIATYAVTALSERARWRREQNARWDGQRLTAYAEYAHAAKNLITAIVNLPYGRRLFEGYENAGQEAPETTVADLRAAEAERTARWEAVLLLAGDRGVQAGREWHQSIFVLQTIVVAEGGQDEWNTAIEAVSRGRRAFYEAARADLGMPASRTPEVFEWQIGKYLRPRTPQSSER